MLSKKSKISECSDLIIFGLESYWKCNCPLKPHVRLLVGCLVCHNFLKQGSYTDTSLLSEYLFDLGGISVTDLFHPFSCLWMRPSDVCMCTAGLKIFARWWLIITWTCRPINMRQLVFALIQILHSLCSCRAQFSTHIRSFWILFIARPRILWLNYTAIPERHTHTKFHKKYIFFMKYYMKFFEIF